MHTHSQNYPHLYGFRQTQGPRPLNMIDFLRLERHDYCHLNIMMNFHVESKDQTNYIGDYTVIVTM